MYTLIKQITNDNMTTADVIAKSDSVIALHLQMVATYNNDLTKHKHYMCVKIDDQLVMGYVTEHGKTAIIYYIIDENNRIISREALL